MGDNWHSAGFQDNVAASSRNAKKDFGSICAAGLPEARRD